MKQLLQCPAAPAGWAWAECTKRISVITAVLEMGTALFFGTDLDARRSVAS